MNCHKVGEGLGGVIVAAVARVYNRHKRMLCGDNGSALFGVAHGDYVGIAADHRDGIGNAFALGGRA